MTLVAIVDYGTGNVRSIGRMLNALGVKWVHSKLETDLKLASHLIMPGVGHCGQAMHSLQTSGIFDILNQLVISDRVPVLGICLGMQLMTSHSEEGNISCMNWFSCRTVALDPQVQWLKVPNIGWHTLRANMPAPILADINLQTEPFYFCHGYGVLIDERKPVVAELKYGKRYAAVIRRQNIYGVQFHPEKSQRAGLVLLKNFLSRDRHDV